MKRILLISVILVAMLLSACAGAVHNTVAQAVAGSPGDFVNFEVVRISPFYGGVSYSLSNDQYAFVVYDITKHPPVPQPLQDDILVVVKNKDIGFEPKDGDFVKIPEGKLVKSLSPDDSWPVYVIAGKVERTSAPTGWKE